MKTYRVNFHICKPSGFAISGFVDANSWHEAIDKAQAKIIAFRPDWKDELDHCDANAVEEPGGAA